MHPSIPSPSSNVNPSCNTSLSGSPSLPSLSTDDVTTIFVVGFPDDLQEREFQNMFMFSKGFEAASLKWHCKDQQEDQDMFNTVLNKKQMIGFARFRTRHEANEAANEMNGKKIDTEKGSILKVEMAKKNLHIKRSVPLSSVFLPEPSSSPMSILSRTVTHPQQESQANIADDYESFSPLPSDLLSPEKEYKDPFSLHHEITTPTFFGDALFCIRSQSFDGRNIYNGDMHPFQLFAKSSFSEAEAEYTSSQQEQTGYFHHAATEDLMGGGGGRKSSMKTHHIERSTSISSACFRAMNNSADQNPPCNTLYVGNLPPATSEDELRSLFSQCEGYKRMCFRAKPQGPMCFVEFEDVVYATQAMSEHQAHLLSNSVKGGIRLSFSKNPLFIKPNKEAGISYSFKQMGTALLADL
ncbi:uncharacterized protein EV154DRAFT_538426 [Mucor mucedo]|uniref:uncharacterized protein n=1 Tax=Mucor mucedo TaxID=29922 RepID=UPI00221EDB2C|nr:uncharacterized protein EV154DRAFT_538426 [Mucor mucedo]KAI7890288.1 hypothetical protein EV154DRAFT_538426 [Mucor mucedo]